MFHVEAKDLFNFHNSTEAPQPVFIADYGIYQIDGMF